MFFHWYLEKSGRWTKSENPISLCIIHHRRNPIVSTELPRSLNLFFLLRSFNFVDTDRFFHRLILEVIF
jgi:hypothetical protein